MKTVKKLLALFLCAALLVPAAGCSTLPDQPFSVWFIAKSTSSAFWKAAFAGAKAAKAEYDLNLTIVGPETEEDYEAENRFIEQAVQTGVDAIVLSAISYTQNARAVTEAIAAGVSVIVVDSDVGANGIEARIGTDNYEAGRAACYEALNTKKKELYVGIINVDADVKNGQERERGFREVLYQDNRVIQIFTAHVRADAEQAQARAEQMMKEHPEINVLVSFNEPLSVGTARAIEAMQLQEQVRMVGFDSNMECIDMMQSGVIEALVVQNPYAMGYLGVETAWKVLHGESFQEVNLLQTPVVVVTKENMFSAENQRFMFPFG